MSERDAEERVGAGRAVGDADDSRIIDVDSRLGIEEALWGYGKRGDSQKGWKGEIGNEHSEERPRCDVGLPVRVCI